MAYPLGVHDKLTPPRLIPLRGGLFFWRRVRIIRTAGGEQNWGGVHEIAEIRHCDLLRAQRSLDGWEQCASGQLIGDTFILRISAERDASVG